jgi:hypothetical protein
MARPQLPTNIRSSDLQQILSPILHAPPLYAFYPAVGILLQSDPVASLCLYAPDCAMILSVTRQLQPGNNER